MTQEELQAAISSALKKGERIMIPNLGYLELQELGGRRTALFKAATPDNSVMQSLSGTPANSLDFITAAQEVISDPLYANQSVNLPEIGTFKPMINDRGDVRVLFMVATPLRKLLNEGFEAVAPPVREVREVREIKDIRAGREEKATTEPEKKVIEVEEPRVPKKEVRRRGAIRIDMREVLIAICAVLLVVVVVAFFSLEKENLEAKLPEVTNLMDEAERHYGNSVYWSYIYEANSNIISSPVNVPKTLKLTYPDLSEQGIDVKNPAEIKKAELKGSLILNQLSK